MSRIKELRQKKADLTNALSKIIDKPEGENGYLSEAQEKEYQAKEAELEQVSKDLVRAEKQRDRELELENGQSYSSNNSGIQVGEDLATKKPWANFGDMLQAVAAASSPEGCGIPNAGRIDPRLFNRPSAASGLQSGVPSEGGYLVQTDFTTELLNKGMETSVLAPRCRRIPIGPNADGLVAPVVDETSRANGSRWGGVQVYRSKEANTVTASKPKFGNMELKLEKLMALCYSTEELLRDSVALQSIMTQAFSEEFAYKVDDEIMNGDGAGECLGILNSAALVTVAKETGQAADTVVAKNISKMWSRMIARSRANAVWFTNQDVEPALDDLSISVGTGGAPVYLPAGGLNDSPNAKLKGRPVISIEQCQTLGDVGDIVLADMSQYLIIDKDGLRTDSSMHVRFVYDEMAFRFITRINGQPIWRSPLTPANGTNTLSPFVALAAR